MINKSIREKDIIRLIEKLDITPTMFKYVTERYQSISDFLLENGLEAEIYPQGSFSIGTVIRPYINSKDADYDLDCICNLNLDKNYADPKSVKNSVGDILKTNKIYLDKLLPEEDRCWTLEYAENKGIGFNLDLVPSVSADNDTIILINKNDVDERFAKHAISITNKNGHSYTWCNSNPKGYSEWFNEINRPFLEYNKTERRLIILEKYNDIYNYVEDVPEQVDRSSLQRVIQILKRHRDVYFSKINKLEYKPISAIITTMAAQISKNVDFRIDVFELLKYVVKEMIKYSELLRLNQDSFGILYENSNVINKNNNNWTLKNPVNPLDNLADSWNLDTNKPKYFFEWLDKLKKDFIDSFEIEDDKFINILENSFGSSFVKNTINTNAYYSNNIIKETTINHTPKPYKG